MLGAGWPPPDDPNRPNEECVRVINAIEAGLQEDPKLVEELRLTADPVAELIRFAKGYYYNQFKKLPDPERLRLTVRILRRCLIWRQQNQVAKLHDKQYPRRKEFDQLWVSGVSGYTSEGRPVNVMLPFVPELMDKFTQDEAAWMHFQENEWLVKLKAEEGRKRNRIILDHVVLVDFGNNTTLKFHSVTMSMINWFRMAVKWEPPDLEPGEHPMDVDGYCYPESLYRMYLINCSFALRTIWNAAKHFVYPSTREKFRILGSDTAEIMKQFATDGVPLSALPPYLGGSGLNPPGLVLQHHLRPNDAFVAKVDVPPEHTVYYRFQSSKPASVIGTCSDGKEICNLQTGTEWKEGSLEDRKEDFSLSFKCQSSSTCMVHYEVSVQPCARFRPAPSPMERGSTQGNGASTPTAWITKRRMFRDSVRSSDQTPLPARKGRMSKWGSWHTGYQARYFQVNNEYLNYFADEETAGPLLGSYNLKKLQHVEADNKGGLILTFDGKHTVWLRAPNAREAKAWVACLEERRRWFDDIPTAAESAKKKALRDSHASGPLSAAPLPVPVMPPPVVKQASKQSQLQMPLLCVFCVFIGVLLGKLLL